MVSTHSRPKAAGPWPELRPIAIFVSTHSRPKAAGRSKKDAEEGLSVSTHSRPKAAGLATVIVAVFNSCFNTQPPEGGWIMVIEP